MRFRKLTPRRTRRPKAETWWSRNCFENSVQITHSNDTDPCATIAQAVDVLADSQIFIEQTDKEEELTPRVIKRSMTFWGQCSIPSTVDFFVMLRAVTVRCNESDLLGSVISVQSFNDMIGTGAFAGNAWDILDIRSISAVCPVVATGFPAGIMQFNQFSMDTDRENGNKDWSIKVRRRLGARDKIATFWFCSLLNAGNQLPTGAQVTMHWNAVDSVLWSHSRRPR